MISRLALLAALALPLPALAQGAPGASAVGSPTSPASPSAPGTMPMPPSSAAPGTSPAALADHAAMTRMHEAMMAVPETGDPDRDFAAGMVPHHQGAIAMAEVELRYGRDPRMRALARSIIASQRREVTLMRSWLATHPPHPAPASAVAPGR